MSFVLKAQRKRTQPSTPGPDGPLYLEAVSPQLAIISVGAENRFGHPSEVTLGKLEGITTYRTDLDGSIEVVSDGSVYWLRTDE